MNAWSPFLRGGKQKGGAQLGLGLQGLLSSTLAWLLCVHGWKCAVLWKWAHPVNTSGSHHLLEHINYLCVFRLNALSPSEKFHIIIESPFHALNLKFPSIRCHSCYPQLQKTQIIFTVTLFFSTRPRINVVTLIFHKWTSTPNLKWERHCSQSFSFWGTFNWF